MVANFLLQACAHIWDDHAFSAKVAKFRSKLTATLFLLSLINDLNLVTDWIFLWENWGNDQITNDLQNALAVFCFIGVFTWAGYVTMGFPCLSCLGCCVATDELWFLAKWWLIAYEVILNDLPMIIITVQVDSSKLGQFTFGGEISTLGALNLATSVVDLLLKSADAWDRRQEQRDMQILETDNLEKNKARQKELLQDRKVQAQAEYDSQKAEQYIYSGLRTMKLSGYEVWSGRAWCFNILDNLHIRNVKKVGKGKGAEEQKVHVGDKVLAVDSRVVWTKKGFNNALEQARKQKGGQIQLTMLRARQIKQEFTTDSPLGCTWAWQNGRITAVEPDQQAHQKGIKAGMFIRMIGDKNYGETLMRATIYGDSKQSYSLTFAVQASSAADSLMRQESRVSPEMIGVSVVN